MWGSLCEVFDQQPVDDTTKLTIQLTTVRGIALLIPPLFTKQAGVSTPRTRDTRNTESFLMIITNHTVKIPDFQATVPAIKFQVNEPA